MKTNIIRNVRAALARQTAVWHQYAIGLALGAMASYAHASVFGNKLCTVFTSIVGNDLYSILAGLGMAGLFAAHSLDEGDNKIKLTAIRIGLAGTGLINLQSLSNLITGSNWGC